MLYVYIGTDAKRTGDALNRALRGMQERVPEAHIERITDEEEFLDIAALISASGLFHNARIIVLDGVCERSESKEELFSFLQEMEASGHLFFVRERTLSNSEVKKLEQHATKLVRYDVDEKKTQPPSVFSLSDALLARDKKQLWIHLVQALRRGSEAEELHGILFWGAKTLALASRAKTPEEAGLHAFVYKKAKGSLSKFTTEEVQKLVGVLTELPHTARRSGIPLEYALEEFVLTFGDRQR